MRIFIFLYSLFAVYTLFGAKADYPLCRYHLPQTVPSDTEVLPDKKAKEEMKKIGLALGKQFHLYYLSNGREGFFTRSWFKETIFSESYYSDRKLTAEQAKETARQFIKQFRQMALASPPIVQLVLKGDKGSNWCSKEDYFTHCLGLKITFWDSDFNYQVAPYVSRIDVVKSEIILYQFDPVTSELKIIEKAPLGI